MKMINQLFEEVEKEYEEEIREIIINPDDQDLYLK